MLSRCVCLHAPERRLPRGQKAFVHEGHHPGQRGHRGRRAIDLPHPAPDHRHKVVSSRRDVGKAPVIVDIKTNRPMENMLIVCLFSRHLTRFALSLYTGHRARVFSRRRKHTSSYFCVRQGQTCLRASNNRFDIRQDKPSRQQPGKVVVCAETGSENEKLLTARLKKYRTRKGEARVSTHTCWCC